MITDEEKDTEKDDDGFLELEAKVPAQSDNKELWLFLIIVDAVFLCVFGIFLYKNWSSYLSFFSKSAPVIEVVQTEETIPVEEVEAVFVAQQPEPAVETPLTQTQPAQEPKPAAEPQPIVAEKSVVEKTAAEKVAAEKPVVEKNAEPTAVLAEPQLPLETAIAEEKKQSIFVQTNPASKYRQVTFRYYGDGKEVAVVSGFTMTKPRAMKKQNGYWETTLSISPGTYKYLFVVDGQQIVDPNGETNDGRSVLVLK